MERPPALKAIIPIFATDDRFGDDVHYFGGARKQLDLVDYPTYMIAMNALPPVPSIFGEGWREEWERRVTDTEPWVINWFEHQRLDDYWKTGSLRFDYDAIQVPTMIIAGWADGYRNNTFRTFEALTCPKRLVIGPWSHAATDTCLPGPNQDMIPEHLKWWDRWLKGVDNGVDREPPILVYAQRSTLPAPDRAEVRGAWRYEPTWPAERLTPTTWSLAKAETNATDTTGDELVVRGDVGWTAWISCAGAMPWGQSSDQRPDEVHSLTFTWDALEDDLEIMGQARLSVRVASTGAGRLPVREALRRVPRWHVLDGDPRHAQPHAPGIRAPIPTPLEPGTVYDIELELEAMSWTFEAGHRVRLDLAGTDWPNAWPPPEPVTLTIDRATATLELPVLDGPSPTPELPVVPPPERRACERVAEGTAQRRPRARVGEVGDRAPPTGA